MEKPTVFSKTTATKSCRKSGSVFIFYVFVFLKKKQISVMCFLLENKWALMSALAPNLLWNRHFLEPLEKTSVHL